MPQLSNQLISLFHGSQTIGMYNLKRAAAEQGGLLSGKDPTEVNTADPIRLWIIQMGVIVTTASLLATLFRMQWLGRFRQPKVIAEVLGGILLGPTAFGRVPGFTEHIFPQDSRPYLSLTANIGLCLFLFLVGLEIEGAVIKRNAKMSVTVALAGMVLPFGLGAGLSVPLYNTFIQPITPEVSFTHFMLFAGVAFSITAFPVLCRILTELRLLDTTVGIVVLSAGVGNDIIGWTLLALSVALVNAGSGLTALYILLVCVGFTLFILFPVKYVWRLFAERTGSLEGKGPSMVFVTGTLVGVFASSFFTDVIGVHAIFGAFLFGLVVPREGGLAVSMMEKLEDVVGSVFLPLYFTLSGLSTDLGLLNTGLVWGYTIAICTLAFIGKFGGCTMAARFVAGFGWREASAIGSLMSCKGLVELIVLNVGLQAHILTPRVFSMFVLEALMLTFMTTPLVTTLYPPNRRVRASKSGANFDNVADPGTGHKAKGAGDHKDVEDSARVNKARVGKGLRTKLRGIGRGRLRGSAAKGKDDDDSESSEWGWGSVNGEDSTRKRNLVVVLDRIEHVPGMMALTQLLRDSLVASGVPGGGGMMTTDEKKEGGDVDDDKTPSGSGSRSDSPTTPELPTSDAKPSTTPAPTSFTPPPAYSPIPHTISALRLIELTDRTSAVMKSFPSSSHNIFSAEFDPLLMIYRTFAGLNDLGVGKAKVSVEALEEMAGAVVDYAMDNEDVGGGMVLVPWAMRLYRDREHGHGHSGPGFGTFATFGTIPPTPGGTTTHANSPSHVSHNPFDALFKSANSSGGGGVGNGSSTSLHAQFVRNVFARCREAVDVGVYLDLGSSQSGQMMMNRGLGLTTVFLPFFGGPDDRLALDFVAQMCENERVRAVVVRVTKSEGSVMEVNVGGVQVPEMAHVDSEKSGGGNEATVASNIHGFPDTFYGAHNTETRLQSQTADNIAWARYASPTTNNNASNSASKAALARMSFKDLGSPVPLHVMVNEANTSTMTTTTTSAGQQPQSQPSRSKLVVVTGRSRRMAVEDHTKELREMVDEYRALAGGKNGAANLGWEVRKTIGDVAAACVIAGCGEGIVVVQACEDGER